jgi:uncharacterized caspase-like protein
MWRVGLTGIIILALLAGEGDAQPGAARSPVAAGHLAQIGQLFQANGIRAGRVGVDRQGRVELQGQFENDREVDLAFSLAQTVVGVRWVSPVTPENVKVKAWEDCLSRLLAGEPCGGRPSPLTADRPPGDVGVPPGPVGNKYGLVVGVGRFRGPITPLQYANKDAYDVYAYLIDPAGGNFRRDNVILLRDEHATRDNVVRALAELQRLAREDDLVFVYFSSHGTPPDKFGGVHVVTYDSEVNPRERIWETSVNETILREFVQNIRTKRLVVLMDACYSNGAYQHVAGFLPPGGKSLDVAGDEGFGRSRRYMAQRILGAKDLVVDDGSPRSTQGATAAGWGKILISASDAGERSWESDQLRNSIFTRYLIDGLRLNHGSVKEAFDYARPLVRQQVKREKGAELEQNPQLTPNRRDWNMSIAMAGR